MILRFIVCIGMVIFCVVQGYFAVSVPSEGGRHYLPIIYVVCPILLLLGLNRRGLITWPIATIFLLIKGHLIIGWIPLSLVVFNLIGNKTYRKTRGEFTDYIIEDDVRTNFVRYCKDYLSDRCNLTKEQAALLVLDPELGPDIDEAKQKWIFEDLGIGTDPDIYLVPELFDNPKMERINRLLEKYACEYSDREEKIKGYLRSIGHPLGNL